MQVSFRDIVLDLSEHSGDGTPGTTIFIDDFEDLESYYKQLLSKHYKYNRPEIETSFFDEQALCVKLIDPFHNQLILVERNV